MIDKILLDQNLIEISDKLMALQNALKTVIGLLSPANDQPVTPLYNAEGEFLWQRDKREERLKREIEAMNDHIELEEKIKAYGLQQSIYKGDGISSKEDLKRMLKLRHQLKQLPLPREKESKSLFNAFNLKNYSKKERNCS